MFDSNRTVAALVLALVLVGAATLASAPVAAGEVATQSNNSSNDATQSDAGCEGPPTMSTNRLYAAETTITEEQEGIIDGAFRVDPTEADDCQIVVDVELQVPSGLEIRGGSDFEQAGGGIVVGTFEVQPGEVRDIRAHVLARDDVDEATVVADYEIWYEGDRENSYQQDGLQFTFQIDGTSDDVDDESEEEEWPPVSLEWGLIGLIATAIVGLVVVAKHDVIVNVVRRA